MDWLEERGANNTRHPVLNIETYFIFRIKVFTPKVEEKKSNLKSEFKVNPIDVGCEGEADDSRGLTTSAMGSVTDMRSVVFSDDEDEALKIMPWRSQLRKTNSKLSLME